MSTDRISDREETIGAYLSTQDSSLQECGSGGNLGSLVQDRAPAYNHSQ